MNTTKKIRKVFTSLLVIFTVAAVWCGIGSMSVYAAGGNVYTCVIHPCYAHPVTGVIEDSGGEASYATGQGMVEGAVYPTGMLEMTDSGEYYLTIRMSLMDYTSGHSFWVQNVGDSDWSSPAIGVTGNGTDSNGSTADVCIQVPSENCVVRGSMYVAPMGRDVVFYLYPSDYTAGNSTDMTPTIVTGNPVSNAGNSGGSSTDAASPIQSGSGISAAGSSNEGSTAAAPPSSTAQTDSSTAPALSSSIQKAAEPVSDTGADTQLNGAQGLSLSTEEKTAEKETQTTSGGNGAFAIGAAVTVSGMLLMSVAAVLIYFFRRNWRRWGGGYDDED